MFIYLGVHDIKYCPMRKKTNYNNFSNLSNKNSYASNTSFHSASADGRNFSRKLGKSIEFTPYSSPALSQECSQPEPTPSPPVFEPKPASKASVHSFFSRNAKAKTKLVASKTKKKRALPRNFAVNSNKRAHHEAINSSNSKKKYKSQAKEKKEPPLPPLSSLSAGQRRVVNAVAQGNNVFFTGCAGTGKSFLLEYLVKTLGGKDGGLYVTASTGIAAVNVGGTTLHSFAGIGFGDDAAPILAEKVRRSPAAKRWRACKRLIVDEVSMIDCALFDKLEYVARDIRGRNQPFGGIQIILAGDFLQLPPVSKNKKERIFCFEAATWPGLNLRTVLLDHVFRQNDSSFVAMLGRLRTGQPTPEDAKRLALCAHPFGHPQRKLITRGGGEKTQQTEKTSTVSQTHLNQAAGANNLTTASSSSSSSSSSSAAASSASTSYTIKPTLLYALRRQVDHENKDRLSRLTTPSLLYHAQDSGQRAYLPVLQKNCQAPAISELKEGAQVMLVTNLDFDQGLVNGSRGVILRFDAEQQGAEHEQDTWGEVSRNSTWPVVKFQNGQERVITPEKWEIQQAGRSVAKRVQVPLILAWALTIHKCQGLTLDYTQLSLGSVFEPGQAYGMYI